MEHICICNIICTIREEKRGLMGRKTSLSKPNAGESSIGISESKTARMQTESTELLKYCAVGLTGSEYSLSSTFNSFTMFLFWASPPPTNITWVELVLSSLGFACPIYGRSQLEHVRLCNAVLFHNCPLSFYFLDQFSAPWWLMFGHHQ